MLTQADVSQELTWAGLGSWSKSTDEVKEFEAYGDGKLSIVHVQPDGKTIFKDGSTKPKTLWQGHLEDGEQLLVLLDKFGHYAPC